MNTWFRKIGMGAVALTLAAALGGCNNGDGSGSSLIELFFGINGTGNCDSVVVEVDLDEADAVIARDNDGDVQCQLDDDLDDDGCDVVFSEPGNGILRATITGCTIPGVSALFSCLFEDVDISDLQDTATGQCDCDGEGCDGTPPVCISTEPDPTSCEICDNGVDDDGNGDVDCEDPNCQNSPDCEGTTTSTTSTSLTSSTTNTINTTTTSSSTTVPVTLPPGLTCQVFLRLADDAEIGSLQFDVDYGDAPGEFLGTGGNVECNSLITGSLASFNDKEDQEILTGGIISLEGFTGPVNVADCTFTSSVQINPDDFTITVTEASDPDLNPVTPTPDVVIVSPIVCEGDVPTTTTLDGNVTTTTEVTPTTVPTGDTFSVLFRLTSASAAAGALQFHTDYSAAPGEFQGTGAAVNCTNLISGALFAPNDIDATNTLNLGIISLSPITAPIDLVRCTFDASGGTPVPADFPVVIDDATDPDGAAIDASISATAVTPIP